MESLHNKVVFITGASSGIGMSCAEQFASHGARIIIAARRIDRLKDLASQLNHKFNADILPVQLDVQNKGIVNSVIEQLPNEWSDIDILINCAGLALSSDKFQDANIKNWEIMINTNFVGLLYVTKAILPRMIARNKGHIINIGSSASHEYFAAGNIYCATKHAVKAISKSLRIDLLGTSIRVSEIDPGSVHTEFSEVRWNDKQRAEKHYASFTPLLPEDIADAAVYCATRKPHINIAEMIIFPTDQASTNHLHKKNK